MDILPPHEAFLGLEPDDAVSYEVARAVVIPFGYEASVSYGSGTAGGPHAILEASRQVELFDETLWTEPFRRIGIATLPEPEIEREPIKALTQLENIVGRVLADEKFPLVLGGEHTVTAGAIRPFAKKYADLTILHFDAHADLRDDYHGRYSHACAIRRCLDLPGIRVVSCGVRNFSREEADFVAHAGDRVRIFWAKDKRNWRLADIVSAIAGRKVYLTFDVDAFDASLMPATGTPEPGGLFWDDVMEILAAAANACEIVGADVVELAPIDKFHASDFLTAKLVYKILALSFAGKPC
mgnify:CR=1 FL=1